VDTANDEWRWTMLMEQSLEGDCAAYHRLLLLLTPALRRAIRSRAQTVGLDAEDVVQEVLLALHLKRNTWVRGTPVAPWVAAIARNKVVDAHRRLVVGSATPEIPVPRFHLTRRAAGLARCIRVWTYDKDSLMRNGQETPWPGGNRPHTKGTPPCAAASAESSGRPPSAIHA